MLAFFQSLRFKLIAMFVAIFALVQILLGTAALLAREHYLHNFFDEQLTSRTHSMAVQLLNAEQPFSEHTLSRVIDAERRSLHFRDFYVQILDENGQLLERSDNLGVYRLPFAPQPNPDRYQGAGALETLHGESVQKLVGPGESLRLITLFIETGDLPPFYLQVATSLTHVQESIAFLRRLFLVVIPLGLLAAAVASWFVTGNAIRQINQVSSVAHQLTPDRLTTRLQPSGSGDELSRMIDEVNEMLDRLEIGFRAQEQFIQDASHELKTPVSVLLSEAQVLRLSNAEHDDYERFTRSVEEEMNRIGKLVESLLLLTRTDGRRAIAEGQVTAINDVVMLAVEYCDPLARKHNVTLSPHLHLPEEQAEEMAVHGDRELIATMISNLARNAIRFAPPDTAVELSVERRDDQAAIIVRDHGPGIPPDDMPKIFQRFQQGSNNGSRGGTGLGLTIARSIAELHQGQIHAENIDADGCRFVVLLPLVG